MGYKFPWSNFHELNLDWILEKLKEMETKLDAITGSATPSSAIPQMDGAGGPGASDNYSRGDHQHPTDTSRAAQSALTQEITDRGNADGVLQTNIDTVDAKIKFSSSAPLMDSSSASAGFSDFQARADHIHPTDTSRASQSDFDTLKARVDGITGSANPSDATPLMDGVGSAGTGGNYSRGDHVHPSDTSKLDTSGGTITGDLTVEGSLSEELRRQYITTNAIGWLRAIKAPLVYGTRIEITISRKGTIAPAEVHKITYVYNQAGPSFVDERSSGDVKYIDKIRVTDAGRIDIHMDQTADSQIGVFIEVAAPTDAAETNIQMLEIEGVADAPAGESILLTYDFNTEAEHTIDGIPLARPTVVEISKDPGFSPGTYTFRGYNLSALGFSWFYFNINLPALTAGQWYDVCTIPADFNLARDMSFELPGQGGDTFLLGVTISGGVGSVKIYSPNGTSGYEFIRGTIILA